MIFHANHFSKYLGEENARLAAKIANELIDRSGTVIYGNNFTNGACENFSSSKKAHDTHVSIAIGLSPMGNLPIQESHINTDPITEEDLVRAQQEQIERLEKENKQLRGISK